jgi:hypothetical protein
MKTRAFTLLFAASLATGCVDNDASVLIDAACFPPAPEDGQCVVSDSCELFLTGIPFVDLKTTGNSFVLPIQLQNQLADNANASSSSTNTHIAFVDELRFTYRAPGVAATTDRDGDGDVDPDDAIPALLLEDVPAPMTSFSIDPGGTAVAWLELIAPGFGDTLVPWDARRVTVEVSAAGHYNSGRSFETGPFQIIADMCRGCAPVVSPCALGELYFACPQPGQTSSFACEGGEEPAP